MSEQLRTSPEQLCSHISRLNQTHLLGWKTFSICSLPRATL
jgi:hypothetical protein